VNQDFKNFCIDMLKQVSTASDIVQVKYLFRSNKFQLDTSYQKANRKESFVNFP
jgi:hypothetical protein